MSHAQELGQRSIYKVVHRGAAGGRHVLERFPDSRVHFAFQIGHLLDATALARKRAPSPDNRGCSVCYVAGQGARTKGAEPNPRTSPITKITRVVAGLLAAYLVVSAFGILTASDVATDVGERLWAGWLLAAAAAIVAGLVIVKRRPMAGTVTLCIGAVLAIGAYFWFPPLWLVSLGIIAGAVWSYRSSKPKAAAITG